MAQKEYNPLQIFVDNVAEAAAVVRPVVEQTKKHTRPFVVYAKDRIIERAVQAVQRRRAKASFHYRLRYGIK